MKKLCKLLNKYKKQAKVDYKGSELEAESIDSIINSLFVRNNQVNNAIKLMLEEKVFSKVELKAFKTNVIFEYTYIIELMLRLDIELNLVENLLADYKTFCNTLISFVHKDKEIEDINYVNALEYKTRLYEIVGTI